MNIYRATITGGMLCESSICPISSQSDPTFDLVLTVTKENSQKNCETPLYEKEIHSKRKIKLSNLLQYLLAKCQHCTKKVVRTREKYVIMLTCNIEWLISVVECEFDYHLGKKECAKKRNEKYMKEYVATQLSGFGEKFYDPVNNISNSRMSAIYPLRLQKN
jgi:hypothetical protein